MMKILVADDEDLARKRVIKLLEETDFSKTIHESSSGKDTISAINEIEPDLVFLDIQMTDMTGFDVIEKIHPEQLPVIVFVTAYDNFAVKAFDVQALDFLLKPYKKERFFEALHRGIERIHLEEKRVFQSKVNGLIQFLKNEDIDLDESVKTYLEKVVLKVGKKYYFIPVDTIKYIVSSAYYAEIFTMDGAKHLYRISMSDFIQKLSPDHFIRVNRSTIVNLREIKEVVSEGQGDYCIVMQDNTSFSLTKNFKTPFLEATHIK